MQPVVQEFQDADEESAQIIPTTHPKPQNLSRSGNAPSTGDAADPLARYHRHPRFAVNGPRHPAVCCDMRVYGARCAFLHSGSEKLIGFVVSVVVVRGHVRAHLGRDEVCFGE